MTTAIIILGAARSGTKILRSAVGAHRQVKAVPHDINFVWKFGNYRVPHDELQPGDAHPESVDYIRKFFESFRGGCADVQVIEKTVSNTLRVAFVEQVFPDAKYVHIIRNGLDVSASSEKKWREPMELRRVLKKLALFPMRAVPGYGLEYLRSYFERLLSGERRVGTWGPRFHWIDEALRRFSLLEVCGLQWKLCVEACRDQLLKVPASRQIEIRYEDLTANPVIEVERLREFLKLPPSTKMSDFTRSEIRSSSVGKWNQSISPEGVELLRPHIGTLMGQLGYRLPAGVGG